MRQKAVAVVGAAETTKLGVIPDMSQIQLHADAALNAMADCGLRPKDIDGVATAGETPVQIAHYLGITPKWVDGTSVGGCSFMIHVRHAAAAIEAGLAHTVLITHGESGKSRVGAIPRSVPPSVAAGPVRAAVRPDGPAQHVHHPGAALHEDLRRDRGADRPGLRSCSANGPAKNPRATFRKPITTDDVLNSRMIAYPFRLLMCCLVTDGGGALILTSADRAKDFPTKPVYILGTGESVETPMVSQMEDFTSSRAFRVAGPTAFQQAGISVNDVDHLMIYDAFAHLPIYGLEDLGFLPRGEAAQFIAERNTAPGGKLPLNTNGGGLSLHALRHVRHVCAAGERAADARHRAGADRRARRSRSATASAACSPRPARSSSPTKRRSRPAGDERAPPPLRMGGRGAGRPHPDPTRRKSR